MLFKLVEYNFLALFADDIRIEAVIGFNYLKSKTTFRDTV